MTSTTVGQRVAELRRARGLTGRALEERLTQLGHRIAQSTLSKIEAGTGRVDTEDLLALAKALHTSTEWLLHGDPITAHHL